MAGATRQGSTEDTQIKARRLSVSRDRTPSQERLAYARAITQHLGEGVGAMDDQGRLTFLNRAAEEMLGWPEEALLGKQIHDIVHFQRADGTPLAAEECRMREALLGRTIRVEEDVLTRRDGSMFAISFVASPIFSGEKVVGAVVAFRDISEREGALAAERALRERLAFIAEASEVLASSLDYPTTLARVARLAVPRIADWCVVDVLEQDGSIRRVASAHVDADKVRYAEELAARYPIDPAWAGGVPNVIRTGKAEIYPEISDELLLMGARDDEHLDMMRSLGMRSVLIVPLTARGRTFGALTLVSAESGRTFGEDELAFAKDLARHSALAVDNARLYSQSASVARTLQESLLPPVLPRIHGVEVAWRYSAAGEGIEVGGDFYDVFRVGRRRWAVVMGDVCGKGAEAAAVTGLARYTIRAAAMQHREPSRILRMLNDAIRSQRNDDRFCTVVVGTVERSQAGFRLVVAAGGHPAPFMVRANGSVEQLPIRGTLLGVFPDPDLSDVNASLAPGDAVVFFTDGVTEARSLDGDIYGAERLGELLEGCPGHSAEEIAQRIEQAVLGFQPDAPRDDIAVLVLRIAGA